MHYGWQLREVPHPKACQVAGSCELLCCLLARGNLEQCWPNQRSQPVCVDWHDFSLLTVSLTLLGCQHFIGKSCFFLQCSTVDRWDALFHYLIGIPHGVSPPGEFYTVIDFCSASLSSETPLKYNINHQMKGKVKPYGKELGVMSLALVFAVYTNCDIDNGEWMFLILYPELQCTMVGVGWRDVWGGMWGVKQKSINIMRLKCITCNCMNSLCILL